MMQFSHPVQFIDLLRLLFSVRLEWVCKLPLYHFRPCSSKYIQTPLSVSLLSFIVLRFPSFVKKTDRLSRG